MLHREAVNLLLTKPIVLAWGNLSTCTSEGCADGIDFLVQGLSHSHPTARVAGAVMVCKARPRSSACASSS